MHSRRCTKVFFPARILCQDTSVLPLSGGSSPLTLLQAAWVEPSDFPILTWRIGHSLETPGLRSLRRRGARTEVRIANCDHNVVSSSSASPMMCVVSPKLAANMHTSAGAVSSAAAALPEPASAKAGAAGLRLVRSPSVADRGPRISSSCSSPRWRPPRTPLSAPGFLSLSIQFAAELCARRCTLRGRCCKSPAPRSSTRRVLLARARHGLSMCT